MTDDTKRLAARETQEKPTDPMLPISDAWDQQIARDAAHGKLDWVRQEALDAVRAGARAMPGDTKQTDAEQMREQLETIKLDLEDLGQYSSALMVEQALERMRSDAALIESQASAIAILNDALSELTSYIKSQAAEIESHTALIKAQAAEIASWRGTYIEEKENPTQEKP